MDTTKVLLILLALLILTVVILPRNEQVSTSGTLPIAPKPGTIPQASKILFSDDFQHGLNSGWSTTTGWEITGGYFWHNYDGTGKGYAYVLRGTQWDDYAVDVDLNPQMESAGIVLRCQGDLMNFVLLYGDNASLGFQVVANGGVAAESNRVRPGFFAGNQHVRVQAKGTTYTVFVNDVERLTFADPTLSRGMPGLASFGSYAEDDPVHDKGAAYFDNFQVTSLK